MSHTVHTVAALPINSGAETTIGSLLQKLGKLTKEDAEQVLHLQKEKGIRFGEAAKHLGMITEADIRRVLARQFEYPYLLPGEGNFPSELVAAYQPFSEQVEMLRAVRSQLMLRWFESGRKALAVVSVNPGEGASLLVANMAIVFSQLGQTTLLIDANLRNPRQHEIFNLKARQGLSDILANRAGIETFSKVEPFSDLYVLPAGTRPPNPQELLNRPSFTALRESLATRFDVILFDVPAFSIAADALAIAARVGGVLLVANKNKTHLADINAIRTQLGRADVEVVGSVLVDG